ncbi:MAG TPA: restriction endonuclease subunit S [Candidatus Saccharimonadales bacterium]|nr:restriction endonuclease subunit S [Candidatus Saccharimonadales bacterium]
MSKIDDLIKQYCPDGVEFKPIGQVAEVGTGNSDRKDATPNGEYPFYVRSKNILRISSYAFDEEAIIIPGEGGVGDIFHYVNGRYALHQRAYRIHFITPTISTKYAYYYFVANFKRFITKKAVNATVASIRKPMIMDFKIAVPPLEVQQEIANILDKFTQLEAELEVELEARKKQYEYYRNQLLTFDEVGAHWTTLGEVAMLKNGNDWKKLDAGDIPVYGSGGVMASVDKPAYNKPTVLIPRKGTITNIFYVDKPFWNVDTVYYTEISDKVVPKFFYYYMKTVDLTKLDMGSGRPSLTQAILNKIRVPVPSIAEQNRIVSILDKFDALVHDITQGLPAEITARRKQYEYYRNKLLTFTELAV